MMPQLAARVREVLHYDPITGVFTWRVSLSKNVKAGAVAGYAGAGRYQCIGIDGKIYYAHRLAWLYTHGQWPANQLDHVNRIRDDNRLANLRECTNTENQQNRNINRNNSSGYTGVSWHPVAAKWVARIRGGGRGKRYLGLFPTAETAHAAYLEAKRKQHAFCPEGDTLCLRR